MDGKQEKPSENRINAGKKVFSVFRLTAAVVLAIAGLAFLQALVMPKYMSGDTEGGMVREYYASDLDHDVLFIGDCEVYANIATPVLWEKYGIGSYIRGSAGQTLWQSYYLLKDALRYEKPKTLVLSVLALKYDEPQKEAYNRMAIDGMRFSSDKIEAARASMMKDEQMPEYIFPLLRYHDRITQLTGEDLTYLLYRPTLTYNGYYMVTDVKPVTVAPEEEPLTESEFGEKACEYLDKIRNLCENEGIELVLYKAPSLYPYWHEEWEKQVKDYAKKYQLRYYNLLEAEIGLDYSTDTYDAGMHFNVYGAEKIADYIGGRLQDECGLKSRRGEQRLEKYWGELVEKYRRQKED